MVDPVCPAGMVLIKPEGAVNPDEPPFCIGKTEVTEGQNKHFWHEGFKKLIGLLRGETIPQEDTSKATPPSQGKPVVGLNFHEARQVCAGLYPGGDLPTKGQWENACGNGRSCTADGSLYKEVEVAEPRSYGVVDLHPQIDATAVFDEPAGPADVGSKDPNPNGVYDMTGNVAEWVKEVGYNGLVAFLGGSWASTSGQDPSLKGHGEGEYGSGDKGREDIGFRCVAPPIKSE